MIFQGCSRPSVYGLGCDKQCPKNCKGNTCHIQEGTCFACESGWTGQHCNTGMITSYIFHDLHLFP